MKKSRWTDYRNRAYRPVRYLELMNGTVALMQAESDDHWRIFTTWNDGLTEKSQPFRMPSVCHVIFEEICAELSEPETDILVEELSDPAYEPAIRGEMASDLCRLYIADDEKYDGIVAKADQFTARHTPAEVEAYIASELAAYRERLANSSDGAE